MSTVKGKSILHNRNKVNGNGLTLAGAMAQDSALANVTEVATASEKTPQGGRNISQTINNSNSVRISGTLKVVKTTSGEKNE